MIFLSPISALIAAALVLPALVLLYFLKMRRQETPVSSTLLWRRAIEDLQANAPFQKLRRNLLLFLQLLILAALLTAMARPAVREGDVTGKRMVILIDHSASMNATDVSPTRLAEAKRLAKELAESVAGGGDSGGAMIVSFAAEARVVEPFTGDRGRLAEAIDSIRPTDEPSRLGPALRLIEQFGRQAKAGPLTVCVVSDGRVEDARGLSLMGQAAVRFLRVGTSHPDNVGIVALSARRDYQRADRVQAYVGLTNYGQKPARLNLTVKLDGQVARVIPAELPGVGNDPPGVVPVSFDFDSAGPVMVEVALDRADDLMTDNVAWVRVAPSRQARVALVTNGNAFLEHAIRAAGVKSVTVLTPSRYARLDPAAVARGGWDGPGSEGFDVAVFDRYSPAALPGVSGLYFGCVPPVAGLELLPAAADFDELSRVAGSPGMEAVLDWRRDAPALRYVAMDEVVLSRPGRLALPDDAQVLATGVSGPVMAEVAAGRGVRAIVTSFDLYQSNWPLEVGFPVFVANAVQSLGLGEQAESGLRFRPGETATVPASAGATRVEFAGPAAIGARVVDGEAVLPMLERVGVYEAKRGVEPPWDRLAVSLADGNESDLRPADELVIGTRQVTGETGPHAPVRREVYAWFLWAALGVMLAEWVVYTRRMHL